MRYIKTLWTFLKMKIQRMRFKTLGCCKETYHQGKPYRHVKKKLQNGGGVATLG
jgi:hypothetical protein